MRQFGFCCLVLFLPSLSWSQTNHQDDLNKDIQELQRLRQESVKPLMDLANKLNISPEKVNKMLDKKSQQAQQLQQQNQQWRQQGQRAYQQLDQDTRQRVQRLQQAFGQSDDPQNPNEPSPIEKFQAFAQKMSKFLIKVVSEEDVIYALQELKYVNTKRWYAVLGFNAVLFIMTLLFKSYKIRQTEGFIKSLGISLACWMVILLGTTVVVPLIFIGSRYFALVSALFKSLIIHI